MLAVSGVLSADFFALHAPHSLRTLTLWKSTPKVNTIPHFPFTSAGFCYNDISQPRKHQSTFSQDDMAPFIPQALFFDFDGVLVDSTSIKTSAFRELFRDFDEEFILRIQDHHRQHGGISRVEKIRYAFEQIMNIPLSEEEHREYAGKYAEIVVENVIRADWVEGAKEYLELMYTRVPIFVISGTPDDELHHVVERRGKSHFFTEVLGSPVRKPAHVANLLQKYGRTPERSVFIGDALTDYDAAIQTGLYFIGIYSEVEFPEGVLVLPDCTGLQSAIAALRTS